MKMRFENEAEFTAFKEELRRRLATRAARVIPTGEMRRSAVYMLLMLKDGQPCVLLTQRSHKVGSHKGQISFPGGMADPGDADALATACRETFEEVGIPAGEIEHIGKFDDYFSIYGFHISSFVGVINHPCSYVFNRDEIDDHVEAPLRLFVEKAYDRYEYYEWQGRRVKIYYYFYQGFQIWGLTARILTDFGEEVVDDAKFPG